jgi:hypothetical protein
MAYLAACWKVFGFSQLVTRTAMLAVAAFSLLGVYRLGRRVANLQIALAAPRTALYPVFFTEAMAHACLARPLAWLWALEAYLSKRWRAAAWFSLAVPAENRRCSRRWGLCWREVVSPCPTSSLEGLRWCQQHRSSKCLLPTMAHTGTNQAGP